jgi:hypothetical protein
MKRDPCRRAERRSACPNWGPIRVLFRPGRPPLGPTIGARQLAGRG